MKMKLKSFFCAIFILGYLAAIGAENVPYSSTFFKNYALDSGWILQNQARKARNWEYDRDSGTGSHPAFPQGYNEGAVYYADYTNDYEADAWLISPAISLTAGTDYTVGIWVHTDNKSENFRIMAGNEKDKDAMSQLLLDKPGYVNNGDFEHFEIVFTPSETGDYYFGIHCYSEEWMGSVYATGFTVEAADGGDSGQQPDPSDDAEELPYSFDFSSNPFSNGWESVKGENSVSVGWTYNSASNYAGLDIPEGNVEDDWLISPALKIEEAGTYSFDTSISTWSEGAMEIMLGTNPDDLSTFSTVIQNYEVTGDFRFQLEERAQLRIDVPGNYYVGFHACTPESQYMDLRVHYLAVKQEAAVPAVVTDLTAVADSNDALEVNLSWTYPTLYNTGDTMEDDAISKVELFRNGDLVNTFDDALPGKAASFIDRPESAGVYKYSIRVYGAKGYDIDNDGTEVSAGFVGHPVVSFPFTYDCSPYNEDVAFMMTVEDANNDGISWYYDTSSSYSRQFVTNHVAAGEMDDYLASPYIPLEAGYYKVTWKAGGSNMSYRLGYATDRHSLADTFTPVASFKSEIESAGKSHSLVMAVPEDGEYVLVVHHTAVDIYNTYDKMAVTGFAIESALVLPDVVSDLNVEGSFDDAVISWINPELDNAGLPLSEIEKVLIYRDGQLLDTLTDEAYLTPGADCSYTDSSVTDAASYEYMVEVYNSNGKSEAEAPVASAFVGHGLQVPQSSSDFHDWYVINADNDWSEWEYNYDGTVFYYSKYYGTSDDYALTPFIELQNGKAYKFDITVSTNSNVEASLEFVAGQKCEADNLVKVGDMVWGPDEADEPKTFTFLFNATDTRTDAQEENSPFVIPAGNNLFGVHATTGTYVALKSYAIAENKTDDVRTVMAFNEGISYKAGMVRTSKVASHIRVIALDGRVLLSATDTDSLSLNNLAHGQEVVVTALIDGRLATLKIVL